MGVDLAALAGWAEAMLEAAAPGRGSVAENPAGGLGLATGAAALAGLDRLGHQLRRIKPPESIGHVPARSGIVAPHRRIAPPESCGGTFQRRSDSP
jgi:hypothetical protein